jgi:hypothetical protein
VVALRINFIDKPLNRISNPLGIIVLYIEPDCHYMATRERLRNKDLSIEQTMRPAMLERCEHAARNQQKYNRSVSPAKTKANERKRAPP